MTAAIPPPDRKHRAAMLRVFARSESFFGEKSRRELLDYIRIAEDTIEAQAAMLRADLTDLQTARRRRAEVGQVANDLGHQCDRLKAENAKLRQLVEAALTAAKFADPEALDIIRQALERTP
ncbi:MAG TPA: hypothetical protein VF365_12970 [Candidatus Limnocylindria bacterium]